MGVGMTGLGAHHGRDEAGRVTGAARAEHMEELIRLSIEENCGVIKHCRIDKDVLATAVPVHSRRGGAAPASSGGEGDRVLARGWHENFKMGLEGHEMRCEGDVRVRKLETSKFLSCRSEVGERENDDGESGNSASARIWHASRLLGFISAQSSTVLSANERAQHGRLRQRGCLFRPLLSTGGIVVVGFTRAGVRRCVSGESGNKRVQAEEGVPFFLSSFSHLRAGSRNSVGQFKHAERRWWRSYFLSTSVRTLAGGWRTARGQRVVSEDT